MSYRRRRSNSSLIGLLIALLVIALLGCGVLIYILLQDRKSASVDDMVDVQMMEELNNNATGTEAELTDGKDYVIETVDQSGAGSGVFSEAYSVSMEEAASEYGLPTDKKIDFASLKGQNSDVYAYIYIPEAGVDAPVLQNEENALHYDTYGLNGTEDGKGCVYTQILNGKDFQDNMTVIYGKASEDNQLAGMKAFRDPNYFQQNPYIYVYDENRVYIYQAFAAYQYPNRQLIIFHNTADDMMYQIYLEQIKDYAGLGSNMNEDIWPGAGDRILTVSTEAGGLDDERFLVQAKLVAVTNVNL